VATSIARPAGEAAAAEAQQGIHTPADLVANGDTLTAQHLRAYLEEA
jgi:hypothetical protein